MKTKDREPSELEPRIVAQAALLIAAILAFATLAQIWG